MRTTLHTRTATGITACIWNLLLSLLASAVCWGQATINTVAGSGTAGFAGDGGPAINARIGDGLNYSLDVATDDEGNFYITEIGRRVRKVNTAGVIQTVAGGGAGVRRRRRIARHLRTALPYAIRDRQGGKPLHRCGQQDSQGGPQRHHQHRGGNACGRLFRRWRAGDGGADLSHFHRMIQAASSSATA